MFEVSTGFLTLMYIPSIFLGHYQNSKSARICIVYYYLCNSMSDSDIVAGVSDKATFSTSKSLYHLHLMAIAIHPGFLQVANVIVKRSRTVILSFRY